MTGSRELGDVTERGLLTIDDRATVLEVVDAFVSGERALTGLDLYYELERATPLLEFHTMIREGPRNSTISGLQQSYGDHNRLLMLGLDKLVEGDLEWLRSRLEHEGCVTDDELIACFASVQALDLTPRVAVALWLAGALHDCGMLCGRGSYVDVEDGLVLSRDVIDALCPAHLRPLAYFVIHHHDYIKDVFLGEAPVTFVADELDALDVDIRPTALAALGLVQIAGAASLGDGRLGAFRMEIARACFDGTALDDRTPETRLGRLLAREPSAAPPIAGDSTTTLGSLEPFLRAAALHGWHRDAAASGVDERIQRLHAFASAWEAHGRPEHLVLSPVGTGTGMREETALNGTRVLVLDA